MGFFFLQFDRRVGALWKPGAGPLCRGGPRPRVEQARARGSRAALGQPPALGWPQPPPSPRERVLGGADLPSKRGLKQEQAGAGWWQRAP